MRNLVHVMEHALETAGAVETSVAESGGPLLSMARNRVGSTLRGKWHLDALLGVGGMAAVYAATHRNGRRAALKILHTEASLDSECRSRFLREGRVANAVGHEGAVKVLDDDVTDDGSVFLILELLEGESLEERCMRLGGRLPETEVLWIADQLLDVLVAAHARGIVHRDIKPDNVFLTTSGALKVLDFGIARLREWSTARKATNNGGTMGTPAFMAPEQARGLWDEVDAQSDLFAVGATMFTLLSGRAVHDGRTQNEEMLSAMTVPVRPLSSIMPDVQGSVAQAVDVALAFEKAKRWRDARSMQEAVRSAYTDRTGKRISMAPLPVVPESAANAMLGLSRDMAVSDQAALAPAKRRGRRTGGRSRAVVAVCGAAAGALVAVGVAFFRPGYGAESDGAAGIVQTPAAVSPAVTLPSSTVVDDRPSPSSETPAGAATDAYAAPTTASPKGSAALKASTKPGCATPFVIDPVTHIKHWKLDCL
jgi:eukaryotic-like serine/threonine-protein kinase